QRTRRTPRTEHVSYLCVLCVLCGNRVATMAESELRRKLRRLITIRLVISTMLLGSATFAQITAPGSFPVPPFFFLIGLTFGLTLTYLKTLRFVDGNRWLIDLQLAHDALIVSSLFFFM